MGPHLRWSLKTRRVLKTCLAMLCWRFWKVYGGAGSKTLLENTLRIDLDTAGVGWTFQKIEKIALRIILAPMCILHGRSAPSHHSMSAALFRMDAMANTQGVMERAEQCSGRNPLARWLILFASWTASVQPASPTIQPTPWNNRNEKDKLETCVT